MIDPDTRTIAVHPAESVRADELAYVGSSGRDDAAHGLFRSLPREQWGLYAQRHLLSSVIAGGITKLNKYLLASAEGPAREEKEFISDVVRFFIRTCVESGNRPRELFESLLRWSEELTRLSLLTEALSLYDETLALEVQKYPDSYVRTLLGKAGVLASVGRLSQAGTLLSTLVERPQIVPDRNVMPEITYVLARVLLLTGKADEYKRLLFRGLRSFHTNMDNRRRTVDQLRKTYRRSLKVILDRNVKRSDRFLFLLHWFLFRAGELRLCRLLGLHRLVRLLVLGYIYAVNYFFRTASKGVVPWRQHPDDQSRKVGTIRHGSLLHRENGEDVILITRAMGGIGDLLMMTPGIRALRKSNPGCRVHLAIPRRYFPVFRENPDVVLLDVEDESLTGTLYKRWYNLTDCPAARIESRTAPRVRKNRTEIFARALGVPLLRVITMDKRPVYRISLEEELFGRTFWREHGLEGASVVGVQLRSEETYRDYPHMKTLVEKISRSTRVLLFDGERIDHWYGDNVVGAGGLPLRQAFALASRCDAIIAPDSAFVHLSAALDIPCIALYGPVDGRVRAKHYRKVTALDARLTLRCVPCWRNDRIPCALTDMRTSACLADISVEEVSRVLTGLLGGDRTR